MTCLLKSRSGSLQSSSCFRLSKFHIPERILDVRSSRGKTRGIYCFSQSSRGNKPGRGAEKNANVQGGGFASLATLLQQRRVEEQKSKASNKVAKVAANTTGKKSLEHVRAKDNKAVGRENSPSPGTGFSPVSAGKVAVAETSVQEASLQPLTKEEQAFSEAVLAALKESAVERQQKLRRRSNNTRKRPSERTATEENRSAQVADAKPIVVKPEWRVTIEALEKKLDKLKQEYYNRV